MKNEKLFKELLSIINSLIKQPSQGSSYFRPRHVKKRREVRRTIASTARQLPRQQSRRRDQDVVGVVVNSDAGSTVRLRKRHLRPAQRCRQRQ